MCVSDQELGDQMQEEGGVVLMCAWGSDSKLGSQTLWGKYPIRNWGLDAGGGIFALVG